MASQVAVKSAAVVDADYEKGAIQLRDDLCFRRTMIVNVMFSGVPGERSPWVLIDAGVMGSAETIAATAKERFGDHPPAAIILTHGHFDHVGALRQLAERWSTRIYAHELELPYLNGSQAYPPPDPTVGGGLMAAMSVLYPRGPFDVHEWLHVLPADGRVPAMPGWKWIHTPGHTPGHVSLWRESDRTIIAGDAFITTKQESAFAVMLQTPELHGPPMYYTSDWDNARESVRRLATLEPDLVITGHGLPLQGAEMRRSLHELADRFDEVALPPKQR
jgi:glyoxylase-like metal-dependent hydrolase (beta-lactamase superfamily II)